jgi:hypothetical protein
MKVCRTAGIGASGCIWLWLRDWTATWKEP